MTLETDWEVYFNEGVLFFPRRISLMYGNSSVFPPLKIKEKFALLEPYIKYVGDELKRFLNGP